MRLMVLVMAMAAWGGAAVADCPEPAPDPVGWWEWVETCHFQTGECDRPGVGRFYPVQRHFNAEGEMETYAQEDFRSVAAYQVACLGNWVVSLLPGLDNVWDVAVSGEAGSRRLALTLQAVDGSVSYWVEREPIGAVPADPGTWSALKAAYR